MSRHALNCASLADGTDHHRLQRLRNGCEKCIADREWDHYGTFTFRYEVTEQAAVGEFERRYVQRLQQRSQGRANYFAVAAKNDPCGRVHVHALLRFVNPIAPSAVAQAWRAGHADVGLFDRRRGASRYIARHVALPESETMWRSDLPSA